jgi:hypothetical protein
VVISLFVSNSQAGPPEISMRSPSPLKDCAVLARVKALRYASTPLRGTDGLDTCCARRSYTTAATANGCSAGAQAPGHTSLSFAQQTFPISMTPEKRDGRRDQVRSGETCESSLRRDILPIRALRPHSLQTDNRNAALRRSKGVIREYENGSSSKHPASSVASLPWDYGGAPGKDKQIDHRLDKGHSI